MQRRKFFKKVFLILLVLFLICFGGNAYAAQTSGLLNNKVYHLINKASGKCLNVNYGTDANGTNVTQYTKDGSREQYFKLVYNSSRDSYKLYTMCSSNGTNRVIDIYRPIQSGANVDIWASNDDDAQDLKIINRGNGYYSLHPRYNTSLALTSYGTGNGSGSGTTSTSNGNVFVTNYSGSNNQLWAMKTGAICHYYDANSDRVITHDKTKQYTQYMGYSYFSRLDNTSRTTFLNDIRNNEIFVWHGHGNAGKLGSSGGTILLEYQDIRNLPNNSLNNLKIALILSCSGGATPSGGTSIVDAIDSRGAKCTVGWSESINTYAASQWNRLFWEKIYSANDTIVEGFRHADYWLPGERYVGSVNANILSEKRVERGDIYQYLY